MQTDSQEKFSVTTIGLHWLVGVMMITLLAVGIYMEENEAYALYPWHKSFGVLIVLFVVLRIAWRARNGWPLAAGDYQTWEKRLSRVVHYVLIIGTLLMPLSGFMMSAMGGHGVAFFGIELYPHNPDPASAGEVLPVNKTLAGVGHEMHEIGGFMIIAAILLHLAGALKHHLVDGDGTLRRMLGATITAPGKG